MIDSYWVIPETEDDIEHFGVKGMKWGVRKKRKSSRRPDRKNASDDYRRSAELSRKPMHELSNKELQDLNYRYNLERQYAQYTKKPLTRGQKFAQKAGKIIVHHMCPLDPEKLEHSDETILSPEYLISCSIMTHNAIHFGDAAPDHKPIERRPGDTLLWSPLR